jgi:RHS repeat-associated protein
MFASRPHDPATGLINMRARWYSPEIGRFLSPDPAGLVDGTNLYAYAQNDPVNFFDPSGLSRQATQDNPGLGTSKLATAVTEALSKIPGGQALLDLGLTGDDLLDAAELLLTVVGLAPGVGMIADGLTVALSAARGNFGAAALSAAAFIPAVGMAAGAVKVARIGKRLGPKVTSAVKAIANKAVKKLKKGFKRGCNCFAAGTLVATAHGLVPIETIEVGDWVLAKDDETGEQDWKQATHLFETPEQELFEVSLARDDGATETIETTPGHPFWVEERGWTHAAELKRGDVVSTADGSWLSVTSTTLTRRDTVYNFTVSDFHTYFVGELGAWVHNTSACPLGAKINIQKQAGHVRGTPQYKNRVKQGKSTSAFHGQASGEKATRIAAERGKPIPGRPNVKEHEFGVGVGTGPTGGTQTRVRVHTSPKTGEIHGHPSGPERF